MISSAWRCLVLHKISTLAGALGQEGAGEKGWGGRGEFVSIRFRSHMLYWLAIHVASRLRDDAGGGEGADVGEVGELN